MRKDIKMRGGNGKKYNKTVSERIDMAGDVSVIVDSYVWHDIRKKKYT